MKFVVGHDDGALAAEAEEFGDILFVDVPESYDNLNLKLLAAMKIVHACYEYRFVFHADDDSFVRIDLLLPERAWLVCAGLVVWLVSLFGMFAGGIFPSRPYATHFLPLWVAR